MKKIILTALLISLSNATDELYKCLNSDNPKDRLDCVCQTQNLSKFSKMLFNNTNYCLPNDFECQKNNPKKLTYYNTPYNYVSCALDCSDGSMIVKNNGSFESISNSFKLCNSFEFLDKAK